MKKKKSPASFLDSWELSALFTGPEGSFHGFVSHEVRQAAEIFGRAAEKLKARLTEEDGRGNHAGDPLSRDLEDILGAMASAGIDLRRAAILEKSEGRGEDASRRAMMEAESVMSRIEALSPKHKKGDEKDEA